MLAVAAMPRQFCRRVNVQVLDTDVPQRAPVGVPRVAKHQSSRPFNASIICSRILNFCGLPVAVVGISVTMRT